MKHTYLSEKVIDEALKSHNITESEANSLKHLIDNQSTIFKITHEKK